MTDKIGPARIEELRLTVPHATIRDLEPGLSGTDPKFREDIEAYLHFYAARKRDEAGTPIPGDPCIACGNDYTFTWGLEHGCGHCHACQWPARLYHFIKDRDGNDLTTVRNILLWAHPEFVSIR